MTPRVVLDTNVLVAALRSRLGAAFKLVSLLGKGRFETVVSVPLVLEYEDALLRHAGDIGFTTEDVDAVLDYLCKVSVHQPVFFLWRPLLPDPKDDMVVEAAVAGTCRFVVTFNVRDFAAARPFELEVVTPRQFLSHIGVLP